MWIEIAGIPLIGSGFFGIKKKYVYYAYFRLGCKGRSSLEGNAPCIWPHRVSSSV